MVGPALAKKPAEAAQSGSYTLMKLIIINRLLDDSQRTCSSSMTLSAFA